MSKLIDLTHTITENIPTWDGTSGFGMEVTTNYTDCTPPDLFRIQKFNCNAGIGTHIDSPAHVIEGGRTVDQLELNELVVPCIVIDVSAEANENFVITPEVVENYEKEHGVISENSLVIFHTGWSKYWNTPEKYINNHIFPSVSLETAQILVKRNIAGLGTDTLSCDTGKQGFPVHNCILGANKFLIENIVNAELLTNTEVKVTILPLKIKGATESPIRLIAEI